jgi:RimJ/RimL family protein N-acetyltransferase
VIRGKTISLRTVREKDLDALYAAFCDVELRFPYMPARILSEPGFRREFQETGFWTEQRGQMMIVDAEDRLLGGIWYFPVAPYIDGLEIGYMVFDRERRGQGIMTEALRLLASYLFGQRKLHRLQLTVMIPNEASRRVARKAGFQLEGIARGAVFHLGRSHDIEVYSLLRGELEPEPPFTPLPESPG